MDRHSAATPQGTPESTGGAALPIPPKRSFASRLFGYDIFLSFALGPPPRGTHSYASDLARRLRERDFSVFFSEDEAPPGEQLDSTLRAALLRSKTLVVIANRGTLREPRWVRTEVVEFRKHHPHRPVIPIDVGRALQDSTVAESAEEWLGYQGKIWLDESAEAVETGIASNQVVERLATAPTRAKSNVKWRWVVRGVIAMLAALTIGLGMFAKIARDNANEAMRQQRTALARQLAAQAELERSKDGLPRSTILAIESLRLLPNSAASMTLQQAKSLLFPSRLIFRHKGPVRSVIFSGDGKNLLSAGEDGVIRIWDIAKQQEVKTVPFAQGASYAIFSPDGRFLAASGKDKILRVWSTATGIEIGHTRFLGSQPMLRFSPEGRYLAVLGEDGVQEWNLQDLRRMNCTNHSKERNKISAIAVSPEGSFLATGAGDEIQVTTNFCQEVIAARGGEGGHVINIAFSPDGKNLAVAREFQHVQIFNVSKKHYIGSQRQEGLVKWVAYEPSGYFVASASSEPSVMIWDVGDERLDSFSIIPCRNSPDEVHFNWTDKVILRTDSTLSFWSVNASGIKGMNTRLGSEIGRAVSQRKITSFSVSPDGQYLVTGSEDSSVRLWNLRGDRARYLSNHGDLQKAFTGFQGKHLLLITGHGRYCEFFSSNGSENKIERKGEREFPQPIAGAAISQDERYSVFLIGRSMEVVDISTRERISTLSTESEIITAAFMQDGKRLVAVETNGEISYWEINSGKEIEARIFVGGVPVWAVFSGDGKRLLIGSKPGVHVWDLEARKTTVKLTPDSEVMGAVVNEDGKYAALLISDHKVQIWDTLKGEKLSSLDFGDLVTDDGFFPIELTRGGKTMAVIRKDGTVLVWDVEGQREVSALRLLHAGPAFFSHDGKYLITVESQRFAAHASNIEFWLWRPEDLIVDACSRLNQNLSESEWRQYFASEPYRKTCSDLP